MLLDLNLKIRRLLLHAKRVFLQVFNVFLGVTISAGMFAIFKWVLVLVLVAVVL